MLPVFRKLLITSIAFLSMTSNANALVSNGLDGAFLVNGEYTLNVADGQVFNFTTIDVAANSVLNIVGLNANQTFTMLASGDINFNLGSQINLSSNAIFETAGSFNILGSVYNSSSSSILTLTAGTNLNGGAVTINHNTGETLENKPTTLADGGAVSITTGGYESYGVTIIAEYVGYAPEIVYLPRYFEPPISNIDASYGGEIELNENLIADFSDLYSNTHPYLYLYPEATISEPTIFITAVPEPSSYALLLSGLALIALARRKAFS